jgi:hypothetical protein
MNKPKVYDLGKHEERDVGEILIGYVSVNFFNDKVVWDTKRLGITETVKGDLIPKRPLFIQRHEVKNKGWVIW